MYNVGLPIDVAIKARKIRENSIREIDIYFCTFQFLLARFNYFTLSFLLASTFLLFSKLKINIYSNI